MPIDINPHEKTVKYHELSNSELKKRCKLLMTLYALYFKRLSQFYSKTYNLTAYFDLTALEDAVIRVDKRLEHAKIFHDIGDSSEYRVISLYCYWLIKLKPFSIKSEKKKDIVESHPKLFNESLVNEQFALFIYVSTVKLMSDSSINLSDSYIKELMYTFRYRDLNKASMILLLEPKTE